MGKYLFLTAICVFQIWVFYQFYKAWKEQKRIEQEWALTHAHIMRTFKDKK